MLIALLQLGQKVIKLDSEANAIFDKASICSQIGIPLTTVPGLVFQTLFRKVFLHSYIVEVSSVCSLAY